MHTHTHFGVSFMRNNSISFYIELFTTLNSLWIVNFTYLMMLLYSYKYWFLFLWLFIHKHIFCLFHNSSFFFFSLFIGYKSLWACFHHSFPIWSTFYILNISFYFLPSDHIKLSTNLDAYQTVLDTLSLSLSIKMRILFLTTIFLLIFYSVLVKLISLAKT